MLNPRELNNSVAQLDGMYNSRNLFDYAPILKNYIPPAKSQPYAQRSCRLDLKYEYPVL